MSNPGFMDPEVLKESLVRAAMEHRTANRYDDQHVIVAVLPDQYRMILNDDDIAEMFTDYGVKVCSHTEYWGDRHE